MAKKTIKYSKTDPTGTTTTNVFENFEPWHYGEPAIPDNLYFLGTDEKANEALTQTIWSRFAMKNKTDYLCSPNI